MTKKSTLLFTLMTLFTTSAFATPQYVGTWCKPYDDFTDVLKIDSQDNALSYSVGNQAGEIVTPLYGYVSLGATRFSLVLANEDQGVVDFQVGHEFLSRRKTLTLNYADGSNKKYKDCSPNN